MLGSLLLPSRVQKRSEPALAKQRHQGTLTSKVIPEARLLATPAVVRVLYTSISSSAHQPKIGHDLGSARLSLITANPAGQRCPLQARQTLNSDS